MMAVKVSVLNLKRLSFIRPTTRHGTGWSALASRRWEHDLKWAGKAKKYIPITIGGKENNVGITFL